jgi:hypothetical protein
MKLAAVGLFLTASLMGASRGYLATPQELAAIRNKAAAGQEPYQSAVRKITAYVRQAQLPAPEAGKVACSASRLPEYYTAAAPIVYGYALYYQISGDLSYAKKVREAILSLTLITALEDGDCPLTMGRHIPTWIRAADLIEDYWAPQDKRKFQNWLAGVIYPSLATKYRRGNNWGAVITNGAQHIADFCYDRPDLQFGGLTAAEMYALMRQTALQRMNGDLWDRCGEGVSMIRPDGGIPEELRRTTTCSDTQLTLDSAAHHYEEGYLAGLIGQAELCWRRGDSSLYDNAMTIPGSTPSGKVLSAGRGSLHRALRFVIDRVPWEKTESLLIAARYYQDPVLLKAAHKINNSSVTNIGDIINQFAFLTHDYPTAEMPSRPLIVAPHR